MNRSTFKVFAGFAGVSALAMMSSMAQAQTGVPGIASPVSSATPIDVPAVADVVVTAQRRSERLQNVPIAVSVLDAKATQALGVGGTTDLSTAVPGLNMGQQNLSVSPFIRGIGNKNTSAGDESAAALYVDGVYIADLAASAFSLNNIDRIEVLKGPQGTLFGRNAAAGVIQIITKDPKWTPSADLDLTYANYDTTTASFYGTAGLTSNIAGDLAVYASKQGDGWGKNLTTGQSIFKGDDISVRSKLLFDLGPKTTLKLAVDYDNSEPVDVPVYRALPGQVLLGGIGYPGFYNAEETINVHGRTHQWGVSATLDQDLNFAELVSISSFRDAGSYLLYDQDGTPANLVTANFFQNSKTYTQELQLLSPQGAPFKWITGLYYYNNNAEYDPLALTGSKAPAGGADVFSKLPSQSYAGYAQATFDLGFASHLTTGIRYTVDDRQIDGHILATALGRNVSSADQKKQFEKPTWRISLDHNFTSDILGYVEYSRGFKSGVFNAVSPTTPAVQPEVVDAVEAGVKSEFFEHRLRFNASAFYNKAQNIQLQVPVAGATTLINAAGAEIKGVDLDVTVVPVEHLEITASASVLDGTYTSFPLGPIFTENPGPIFGYTQTAGSLAGKETIASPPFTAALTGRYTIPTEHGDFGIVGSYYYSSRFFFDPQNIARQPQYNIVDGSLTWTAPNKRYEIDLWGKNLTGARYYANIVPQVFGITSMVAAPLTFGVTLRLHL